MSSANKRSFLFLSDRLYALYFFLPFNTILNWNRTNTVTLFLSQGESFQSFTINIRLSKSLPAASLPYVFIMKFFFFLIKCFFLHTLRWSPGSFFFLNVRIVNYKYWFLNITLHFLHSWFKFHFIMH